MSYRTCFASSVLVCSLAAICTAQDTTPIQGQWTIDSLRDLAPAIGKVQLSIQRSSSNSHMSSSNTLALDQLRGITPAQMNARGATVRFEIARDAGTFQCDGYFRNGNGGGTFVFTANQNFISEMRGLGFDGLSSERVFSMAVHDVSSGYVRDLRALGINPSNAEQLMSLRIHNVSIEYIREMKDLGYSDLSADRLVTMRIHGVSTDFARELKTLGYNAASPDQMVTMRIHGASTDFIKQVKALGYDHPSIDQLVTMRIHGVSPEYIQKLQTRGMRNLSIDQLVNLRIHGIVD